MDDIPSDADDRRPALPRRRSTRLRGYDYASAGAYFVTVCTAAGAPLLSVIRDGVLTLTPAGKIVEEELLRTPIVRPRVILDVYVIMPNHWHGVLFIEEHPDRVRASERPGGLHAPTQTVGAIVAGIKGASTARIHALPEVSAGPVWQRNYYDHIVRDDADMARIREYIINNPLRWADDKFYRTLNQPS